MKWMPLILAAGVGSGVAIYNLDSDSLSVDPESPQDDLAVLTWVLRGQAIEIAPGVDFVLTNPTAQEAQARFPRGAQHSDVPTHFVYGSFRQTGENQASYMCPTLGTVTFQISEDSIRWQVDGRGGRIFADAVGARGLESGEVERGGTVACGPRCARALAQLERESRR